MFPEKRAKESGRLAAGRWAVLIFAACLSGCAWWSGDGAQGILILAVDGLGYEDIRCGEAELNTARESGFREICESSVRFTHAFTTSTLTQPALASIFTGLYPHEHGVRDNGSNFLPASQETVAEVAARLGYRTGFFAGGAPVFGKSGLVQGFEVFDDRLSISPQQLHRSVPETFQRLLFWLDDLGSSASIFAVVHAADLVFKNDVMTENISDIRERGRALQLRTLDEALGQLIRDLKRRGRWEKTHFVLVGLNGYQGDIEGQELAPLQLGSRAVQVALFVKAAQKKRDLGLNWSVDQNVTVADLGPTILEWLGAEVPTSGFELPRVSLATVVTRPQVDFDDNRLLLTESGWPRWRLGLPVRMSARLRQYLYIHDQQPQLFNTLIDRQEVAPVPTNDSLWLTLDEPLLQWFRARKVERFPNLDPKILSPWQESSTLWNPRDSLSRSEFVEMVLKGGQSAQNLAWALRFVMETKDWSRLLRLGEVYRNSLLTFLAHRLRGEPAKVPRQPCGLLFRRPARFSERERNLISKCEDEFSLPILRLVEEADGSSQRRLAESLARRLEAVRLRDAIAIANHRRFQIWDVQPELPRPPSVLDWMILLPGFGELADLVKIKSSEEDLTLDL